MFKNHQGDAASSSVGMATTSSNNTTNIKTSSSKSSSSGGSKTTARPAGPSSAGDCAAFDVAIIDSTDFTIASASPLHSAPFYQALHQIMQPEAALIQIVEIYMRLFEQDFQRMEAGLRQAGWSAVGRSTVYTPSYSVGKL